VLGQQVVTLLSGPGLGAFSRDTCALAARRLPSASSYDVVLPAPGVVLAATKSGKSLVIDGYSAPQPGL
jgi:hypothetical protein